jgi:hypothetical protein
MISDAETPCCPRPSSFVYFDLPIQRSSEPLRFNKSLEDKLIAVISSTPRIFGTLYARPLPVS